MTGITPDGDAAPRRALASIAESSWFRHPAQSSIWVRIISMAGMKPAAFGAAFQRDLHMGVGHPIVMAFGTLHDFQIPRFWFLAYANAEGQTVIQSKIDQLDLPEADYWIFAIPYKVDGTPGIEPVARSVMARASALMVAHFGLNAAKEVAFEGELDVEGGQQHSASHAFRAPLAIDGPFLHDSLFRSATEVGNALRRAPTELRERVNLALEFFERAIRHDEEFLNYWIALEILCNGKAQRIRARIQAAYGLPSIGDVDRQTGFGTIARWRHEFFHRGKRRELTADVARYVQLLFVDLLRLELGLSTLALIGALQTAAGYDLSPIGLADRRAGG